MDETEIDVSWRAAIILENGALPIYGRLSKIGKGRAVVKIEHNLRIGSQCGLSVLLPKNSIDEPTQFVEGRGVVAATVLSSTQFHVTLNSLFINGNGKELLNEHFNRYKAIRKVSKW